MGIKMKPLDISALLKNLIKPMDPLPTNIRPKGLLTETPLALIFDIYGAQLLKKIEFTSTHDKLTGLKNRAAIDLKLAEEIKLARRYKRPFSILLLDIDHFKQVNDQHGHHAGDEALRAVGDLLRRHVRETDTPGRFGGEEFIILAPTTGGPSSVILAERILSEFRKATVPIDDKGGTISITASIGIASISDTVNDADQLLKSVDQALYTAKSRGRDRFCI